MGKSSSRAALILAAGQGKRMQSELPKVLHPCADLPLVCHVVRLALARQCNPVVVVVSPATRDPIAESLAYHFAGVDIRLAVQQEPRGTGDAARAGLAALDADFQGQVFLLYGDVPLLRPSTLEALEAAKAPLTVLSAVVADPAGYGRLVRDAAGTVQTIVEDRDCSPAQLAIREVNAGVYLAEAALLRQAVATLKPQNVQNEYYLTDIVPYAAQHGGVHAVAVADVSEIQGVNSRSQLAVAERHLHERCIAQHAAAGVTFHDAAGTFVGVDVRLGRDVDVGVGVQIYGATRIGDGVRIEGPTVIRDATIEAGAHIHSFSHIERAHVGPQVSVGPFARLRPEAHLEEGARVGNFVEVKKARLGKGAKANHLAYIGDAQVGPGSNLGAGTITCNYDGFGKHRTEIGANVFVGSNSTLVAPIELQDGAFVAAGSVVTRGVPQDALAFGRAQQVNRDGYAKTLRERLRAQAKTGKKA